MRTGLFLALKVASPYLCLDAERIVAQLQAWRHQTQHAISTSPVDDKQHALFKSLQERVSGAPASTPWLEKGMSLAMALQHLPADTRQQLLSARSRESFWEGLAYAVLHSSSVAQLTQLEASTTALFPQHLAPPKWFSAALPPTGSGPLASTVPHPPAPLPSSSPEPTAGPLVLGGAGAYPAVFPPPVPGSDDIHLRFFNLKGNPCDLVHAALQHHFQRAIPMPPDAMDKGFWYGPVPRARWLQLAGMDTMLQFPLPSGGSFSASSVKSDGTSVRPDGMAFRPPLAS